MVQGKLTRLAGLNVMDTMVGPSCLGHATARMSWAYFTSYEILCL